MARLEGNYSRPAQKPRKAKKRKGGITAAARPDAGQPRVSEKAIAKVKASPQYKRILAEADLGRRADKQGKELFFENNQPFIKTRRRFLPDVNTPVDIKGKKIADVRKAWKIQGRTKAMAAPGAAPVLKILEKTVIPAHAVGGVLTGHTPGYGVRHKILPSEGTVKKLGLKKIPVVGKPLEAAASFGADVVADPTTYITFGTGSVAVKAARQAAKDAERAALKAGRTQAVAKGAGRKAAAKVPRAKGITVKFAGRNVPGVTKTTAVAGQGTKRAAAKVAEKPIARKVAPKVVKAGRAVKGAARDVRPTIRPTGADEAQFIGARGAAAQARAHVNRAAAQANAQARAYKKALGEENYARVVDAVERGKVGSLKEPELRKAAVRLRSDFRYAKRVRRRAGLAEGTVGGKTTRLERTAPTKSGRLTAKTVVVRHAKDGDARQYFPHAREDALHAGLGITDEAEVAGLKKTSGSGTRVTKPGSAMKRSDKRPISVQNAEREAKGEPKFSTNVPLVTLNYHTETAKVAAKSQFARELASLGRKMKEGESLREGERLYHLGYQDGKLDLHEVKPNELGKHSGQYVALNKRVVEDAKRGIHPAQAESTLGRGFDKTTSGFKRLATFTPGFHVRNLIGDTQMAYLAQPGHKLPGNIATAGKALKRLSEREGEKRRVTLAPSTTKQTVKIAGKHQNVDEFLNGATKHGVVRSGFIGRELEDLAGRSTKLGKVKRGTSKITRLMQNREDLMRLATYKHGLDKGMTPAEAARLSREIHIDYGDLSNFERKVGRRVAPFYTFNARALPLHAKKLVTNPGKFANYEKLREEASKDLGLDIDQFDRWLQEFQQRLAPLPAKLGGALNAVSAGLPLTLLNEIPTDLSPKGAAQWIDEAAQYALSLANPILKDPVELFANRSFFFRNDIEPGDKPLVAAPAWVRLLPDSLKKATGATPNYIDRRTGKKTWGWRGKADYIVKALGPGPINVANQLLASGSSRRGQGTTAKAVSGLSGIKADVIDKYSAQIGRLYKQSIALDKKIGAFHQQGVFKKNPTPELLALLEKKKTIDARINQLSQKRGDKVPLKRKPGRRGSGTVSMFGTSHSGPSMFEGTHSQPSMFGG